MKLIPALLIGGMLAVSGWAEESQVPFKVGDVVTLWADPTTDGIGPQMFIVKQIKGKWVSGGEDWDITGKDGKIYRCNDWMNTDLFRRITVNDRDDLSHYGIADPPPKLGRRTKGIVESANVRPNKEIIPNQKKDAEQVPDFADLVKRAESGDATAQWELGCWYQLGTRVGKDEKEAVKWFIKSAEQGFAKAQALLGGCYERGKGVVKDEKEAVKWYTKSAEQGNEGAQLSLGICYSDGTGVGKDEKEAVKWYTKAAEQGFPVAQYELGVRYENGTGVGKDEKEAVKWYTKAAEQGDERAKRKLEELKNK